MVNTGKQTSRVIEVNKSGKFNCVDCPVGDEMCKHVWYILTKVKGKNKTIDAYEQ